MLSFQGNVNFARKKDTAACRLHIVGVGTTAAQGLVAEEDGAQLLLITTKTNCGGTAEEDVAVRMKHFSLLFVRVVHCL